MKMKNNDKKTICCEENITHHHSTNDLQIPQDIDQYGILRLVKKIQKQIGVNSSQVALYEFLISYTRKNDWEKGNICICFASVEFMAEQLGKSVRQIQLNTDALVRAGLISLKLSGNYRRGGQRDESGKLVWASGADLKTVLLRLDEFQAIEASLKDEFQQKKLLHKNIGSIRREMRMLIEEYCPDIWNDFKDIIYTRSRLAWSQDKLQQLWDELQGIWAEITAKLQVVEKTINDHENCSHGRNKLQTPYNTTIHDQDLLVDKASVSSETSPNDEAWVDTPHAHYPPPRSMGKKEESSGMTVTLGAALNLISVNPNGSMALAMHGLPENISSLVTAAHRSCQLLGISDYAWREACAGMGIETAALAVASIDAKGTKVKNPGGYLRGMIKKQRLGKLKLSKTIQGLISNVKNI